MQLCDFKAFQTLYTNKKLKHIKSHLCYAELYIYIYIYTHTYFHKIKIGSIHCLLSRYKLQVLLETFKYILDLSEKLCPR